MDTKKTNDFCMADNFYRTNDVFCCNSTVEPIRTLKIDIDSIEKFNEAVKMLTKNVQVTTENAIRKSSIRDMLHYHF